MTYLSSILLGFIQGVAEFLPISSSGHLAIAQNLLNLDIGGTQDHFFDVLLHMGTLIAIFIVYWRDIWDMICEFFGFFRDVARRESPKQVPPARRLILLIIIGTLPLFAVLPVKDKIEALSSNMPAVGAALLVTGVLLFMSDRFNRGRKSELSATVLDVIIIGIGQAIATVPGISRSGMTISLGCFCGLDRRFAVRYSFLMSVPAVLGANILSLKDAVGAGIDTSLLPVYAVGVLTAAVFGYLSIRLLKFVADKGKFGAFAYYCWAVGALTLIASLV